MVPKNIKNCDKTSGKNLIRFKNSLLDDNVKLGLTCFTAKLLQNLKLTLIQTAGIPGRIVLNL